MAAPPVFSRRRTEEPWNEVALGAAHHLHGIHRGCVSVRGRAGERPDWRMPPGAWITWANDDAQAANSP